MHTYEILMALFIILLIKQCLENEKYLFIGWLDQNYNGKDKSLLSMVNKMFITNVRRSGSNLTD